MWLTGVVDVDKFGRYGQPGMVEVQCDGPQPNGVVDINLWSGRPW